MMVFTGCPRRSSAPSWSLSSPAERQGARGQRLMSRERLLHAIGGFGSTVGIVVVVHGGRAAGRQPASPVQLSVLRMRPVARSIRHALRGSQVVVKRPRFRLRGWNGDDASPVGELSAWLDQLARDFGRLPVVL